MKRAAIAVLSLSLFAFASCDDEEDQEVQEGTPAEQQDTAQSGGPRFTISLDQNTAEQTGGECTAGARVDVTIEIGGGAAANQLRGTAYCDTNQVANTALLADPGNNTAARTSATGQQTTGQAKCSRGIIWGNPRSQNITVVCDFY